MLGGARVNAGLLASYGFVIVSEQSEDRPTPGCVRLSAHAVEQYRRRVKAGLELEAARAELGRGGWVATTCVANLTLTSARRAAKSNRKGSVGAQRRAQRRARL